MAEALQRGLPGQVLAVLHERILSGEIPPSTRLNEVELAQEFGISRAPLREAIRALTSQGLLTYRPSRGATVISADPAGVDAILELRSALECAAASLAARRRTQEQVDELRTLCRRSHDLAASGEEFPYLADLDFHHALTRAASSPRIADEVWRVQQQVIVLRSQRASDPVHTRASLADHDAITDAIAGGHAEEAAALMATHVDRVRRQLLANL